MTYARQVSFSDLVEGISSFLSYHPGVNVCSFAGILSQPVRAFKVVDRDGKVEMGDGGHQFAQGTRVELIRTKEELGDRVQFAAYDHGQRVRHDFYLARPTPDASKVQCDFDASSNAFIISQTASPGSHYVREVLTLCSPRT